MIRVGLDSEIGELNKPWAKYLTVDRNSIIRSGYQIIYSNKNIVFNYFLRMIKELLQFIELIINELCL